MNEHLTWWKNTVHTLLTRFARPEIIDTPNTPIEHYDQRLDELDRKQQEIRARMKLIELQAHPRGQLYD